MSLAVLLLILQAVLLKSTSVKRVPDRNASPDILIDDERLTTDSQIGRNGYAAPPQFITGASKALSQSPTKLRLYKGPFPRIPGTTESPWIALHSPVKMYIPIRYTDQSSAMSADCVRCPKDLVVHLRRQQKHILTPVPTISICSGFAHRPGRVHVAVVSGPRPGQRLTAGHYDVELMVWKAEGPVHSCKYSVTVKGKRQEPPAAKKRPCPKPVDPPGGIVLCEHDNKHPHNSVCQFFCLAHFLIQNETNNSSTIVCRNGQWSPQNSVICVATFCPVPPPPLHGAWDCALKDLRKDDPCQISCAPGYVLPTSQLSKATIHCSPPSWNQSIPVCKRAHLPKLLDCHERYVISPVGQTVRLSDTLLPKSIAHGGRVLVPVCSLQGVNLSKGLHTNHCEVKDMELRTEKKCQYNIRIEESSNPQLDPEDCRNRTVETNRHNGTTHLKPVRFFVTVGEPARKKVLHANCTPSGELGLGSHAVQCTATDSKTNLTDTCFFWLTVQDSSRPQPHPEDCRNRTVEANSLNGTTHLKAVRFLVTVGEPARKKVLHANCTPSGELGLGSHAVHCTATNSKTNLTDTCFFWLTVQESSRPQLHPEDCRNRTVEADSRNGTTYLKPVRFLVTVGEPARKKVLHANCTPTGELGLGSHAVHCTATNSKTYLTDTCSFWLTVQESSRPQPHPEDCRNRTVEANSRNGTTYLKPVRFLVTVGEPARKKVLHANCTPSGELGLGSHAVHCTATNSKTNLTDTCFFWLTVQAKTCPPLKSIPNGRLVCDSQVVGALCTYECELGSATQQRLTRVCQPNLRWQPDLDPVCERIVCAPLPPVSNGRIECNATEEEPLPVHTECRVMCESGHFLTRKISSAVCQPNNRWNVTGLDDCVPVESPRLLEGCDDRVLHASSPINITVMTPLFLTYLNETALVSCMPCLITSFGDYRITCIVEDDPTNTTCEFNITVLSDPVTTTSTTESGACEPLRIPLHGSVNCTSQENVETCEVTCGIGYGFPGQPFIRVECTDKLWDFQKEDIQATLPDCLAQVEGSAVEVWVSFEAFAPQCDEAVEDEIKALIKDQLCLSLAGCEKVFINCTLDEESDMMWLVVNWTIQADFNEEDFYDDYKIPEAETRLETVLEKAKAFITSGDSSVSGLQVFRDSYQRGLITLVCPNGYVADMLMAKCVECLGEATEPDGRCPCNIGNCSQT